MEHFGPASIWGYARQPSDLAFHSMKKCVQDTIWDPGTVSKSISIIRNHQPQITRTRIRNGYVLPGRLQRIKFQDRDEVPKSNRIVLTESKHRLNKTVSNTRRGSRRPRTAAVWLPAQLSSSPSVSPFWPACATCQRQEMLMLHQLELQK